MLTWKTVGMHVPSSFSSAICVQSMEESRRMARTMLDQVYTCIYIHICVCLGMSIFNYCLPDDLLRKLVFFNTFEELKSPIKGRLGTYGGRISGQAVRTIPNPVSVRSSSREHGGQSPPYAIVSGWKRDSNDPSPVQQAQGFWFPHGLR